MKDLFNIFFQIFYFSIYIFLRFQSFLTKVMGFKSRKLKNNWKFRVNFSFYWLNYMQSQNTRIWSSKSRSIDLHLYCWKQYRVLAKVAIGILLVSHKKQSLYLHVRWLGNWLIHSSRINFHCKNSFCLVLVGLQVADAIVSDFVFCGELNLLLQIKAVTSCSTHKTDQQETDGQNSKIRQSRSWNKTVNSTYPSNG